MSALSLDGSCWCECMLVFGRRWGRDFSMCCPRRLWRTWRQRTSGSWSTAVGKSTCRCSSASHHSTMSLVSLDLLKSTQTFLESVYKDKVVLSFSMNIMLVALNLIILCVIDKTFYSEVLTIHLNVMYNTSTNHCTWTAGHVIKCVHNVNIMYN